ncbi:MAG: hypothetical protein N3E50_07360 [Candidatus Goldbacteria bacterium]|nr:hypothetical protein [Candidatus Goldiibacteriota bacterium]
MISALFDTNTDIQWVENQIHRMAENLKQKIGNEANPDYIIKIFNEYFFY